MTKPSPVYEQYDRLGQPYAVGNYVAFSSYRNTVLVGQVIKITAKRVRVDYNSYWEDKDGHKHHYNAKTLCRPERCIVLGDTLQQYLTLEALKRK